MDKVGEEMDKREEALNAKESELKDREEKLKAAKEVFAHNWLGDVFHGLNPTEAKAVVKAAQDKADEFRAARAKARHAPMGRSRRV